MRKQILAAALSMGMALAGAAQACEVWDVSGDWGIVQQNAIVVDLDIYGRDQIRGEASYEGVVRIGNVRISGTFRGQVEGALDGDQIELRVLWRYLVSSRNPVRYHDAVAIYRGTVSPAGRVEGTNWVASDPDAISTWNSTEPLQCAVSVLPPLAPLDVDIYFRPGQNSAVLEWTTPDQADNRPIDIYVVERQAAPGVGRPVFDEGFVRGPRGAQTANTRLDFNFATTSDLTLPGRHVFRVCAVNMGGRACSRFMPAAERPFDVVSERGSGVADALPPPPRQSPAAQREAPSLPQSQTQRIPPQPSQRAPSRAGSAAQSTGGVAGAVRRDQ